MSGDWSMGPRVEEEIDEEGGYSTTELFHRHFCEDCGSVWSHSDDSCMGPRWVGRMYVGGMWACPLCEQYL